MTNFTILHNEDITNTNISNGAFRLYVLLNSMCYGNQKNTCYPSQQYLSTKLGRSVRTIQRYIKELVQFKLIKIKHRGSISNVYTVLNKITNAVTNAVNKAKNAYNNHFKGKKIAKTNFNDYEQRNYNWDSLEKMLLGEMEYNPEKLE